MFFYFYEAKLESTGICNIVLISPLDKDGPATSSGKHVGEINTPLYPTFI